MIDRVRPAVRIGGASLLFVLLLAGRAAGDTIFVNAGDHLQAALDAARPGDVIRLQEGATFVGNFVLPPKNGPGYITIRSAGRWESLPASWERVGPEHEPRLPTIESPNVMPALRTAAGAHDWYVLGVRFLGGGGNGDVVRFGDGSASQNDVDLVPQQIVLDRVIIRGHSALGQKRGIALNSRTTTIRNSVIAGIALAGQESQAIAGWNGPGPYTIENNYLEAAGVNVMFGGAAPFIPNLVPSDITFRRNHVTKQLAWRGMALTVKNLFELKNARRVLVEGNLFEHNWMAAQAGYAILFTVRNPGNLAPWATVEDVTFQNNVVRRVAAGINILGYDYNAPSGQTRAIVIRNNLFYEIDRERWGGNGTFLLVGDEAADIVVEHNTIVQSSNIITVYGGTPSALRPVLGFRFVDNITLHNQYGIAGSGVGVGNAAIAAYLPGSVITANALAGGDSKRYPAGHHFPTVAELFSQFTNPAACDYRLRKTSSLSTAATDGGSLGVDFTALNREMGVILCDAGGR